MSRKFATTESYHERKRQNNFLLNKKETANRRGHRWTREIATWEFNWCDKDGIALEMIVKMQRVFHDRLDLVQLAFLDYFREIVIICILVSRIIKRFQKKVFLNSSVFFF